MVTGALGTQIFGFEKWSAILQIIVEVEFPEALWLYTMVSVAASGNTSWVCDLTLVSYALEQPESPDYKHKCHAPFKCAPTV